MTGEKKKLKGFASMDKERLRQISREARAHESPAERSERGRKAIRARWERERRGGMDYEDMKDMRV